METWASGDMDSWPSYPGNFISFAQLPPQAQATVPNMMETSLTPSMPLWAWMSLPLWVWGVTICVIATGMTAFGLVLQKYSHTLNALSDKSVVYYRQPWWLVGISIFAVAQVINLISMSLAPQVMLSCLGATALIFNAIFARLVLEEELHMTEIVIMLGMCAAVMMVLATTPVLHQGLLSREEITEPIMAFPFLAVAAALLGGGVALRFLVVDTSVAQKVPDIEPLTWCICAAASSGYTVNLMQAASMLIGGWPRTQPHRYWECYLILAWACAAGVSQVNCLNRALNTGTAMMVVPTYFSLGLMMQLGISNLISLDVPTEPLQCVIFGSGIVLILAFIVLLVRTKIAYEEDPEAEMDEIAEVVFQSWPSTPVGSPEKGIQDDVAESERLLPLPSTPPAYTPSKSLPPEDLEKDMSPGSRVRLLSMRGRCNSLSFDAFQESFEGRERTYSVALIGFGLA